MTTIQRSTPDEQAGELVAAAIQEVGEAPRTRHTKLLAVAVSLALLPVIWAVVAETGVLGTAMVGPIVTAREIADNWSVLWLNAEPTLVATTLGVLILLAITLIGAVMVALVPAVTPAMSGLSIVVGTLPLLIITPIISLMVTRGRPLVATICVLAGLVPVAAMLSGMARVGQRGREELGALYGASRLRWWRYVGFWQTVPVLDFGIRAMIPYCLVGSIVAEWSGASSSFGLGEVMTNALFSYEPALLWATIVLTMVGSLGLLAVASVLLAPIRRIVR